MAIQLAPQFTEFLIKRFEKKGLASVAIPGVIRDVANIISIDGHMGLKEINRRLNLLGWDSPELDYQTLQLIIANLEADGISENEIR